VSEHAQNEPDGSLEKRRARERARRLLFGDGAPVTLGRFEIGRRIGAGAMGVVYEAQDPHLERAVAIKVIDEELGASAQRRQRMLKEAKAMARLSHPNVVVVHDVGEQDDRVFIAMELVKGDNLKQWLEAERRDVAAICAALAGAGRGLLAAHEHGLVHRDIKPENVLIDREGRARLADFGVVQTEDLAPKSARMAAESGDQAVAAESAITGGSSSDPSEVVGDPKASSMTATGALVGTPAYMSPEQLHGRQADPLSDQFAFCVTFYEALYGVRPYDAATIGDLVLAMTKTELTEPVEEREVPPAIHGVLARGLRVDPHQRFPSMRELLDALDEAMRAAETPKDQRGDADRRTSNVDRETPPPSAPPRRTAWPWLAMLLVAGVGAGGAWRAGLFGPAASPKLALAPVPSPQLPESAPTPRYALDGLEPIADDCSDAQVLLASTSSAVEDRWGWTRQALLAHPDLTVTAGTEPGEEGEVALSEVVTGEAVALIAACRPRTCNRLAAMYKAVVRSSRPRLSCGPFGGLEGERQPVELLRPGPPERNLPSAKDVRAMCARLAACRIAADPTIEGDPGIDCQKAPHRFRTRCALAHPCEAVLACLDGGTMPDPP
jgi:serine/threonine protein kinase